MSSPGAAMEGSGWPAAAGSVRRAWGRALNRIRALPRMRRLARPVRIELAFGLCYIAAREDHPGPVIALALDR